MCIRSSKKFITLLALAALLGLTAPATAQYYPGYPPGYYPPSGPAFGPGGAGYGAGQYLQGSASVINATGNLAIQNQQAAIVQQQAQQEKLVTRKKAFDELAYEKANTPSFTEIEEKNQAMQLRRVMNNPPVAEITSGSALNTMLPYLGKLTEVGTAGPQVPLTPDLVQHINVTVPNGSNPGLLRGGGKLEWPLALRGETQKKIDALYQQAIYQAAKNELDPALYSQLRKESANLNKIVLEKMGSNELDGSSYLAAKHFIAALDEAVRVLPQPNAVRFLNGSYSAKGNSVQEVIQNMWGQGLQFAAANPGDENYYVAMYRAMVAFSSAITDDNAIRVRLANQQPIAGKSKK